MTPDELANARELIEQYASPPDHYFADDASLVSVAFELHDEVVRLSGLVTDAAPLVQSNFIARYEQARVAWLARYAEVRNGRR